MLVLWVSSSINGQFLSFDHFSPRRVTIFSLLLCRIATHRNVSFVDYRYFKCLPPSIIFLLTILYFAGKETLILM